MTFSVTQYNTSKDCFKHDCLVQFGSKYDHVLESHMDAVADSTAEDAHIVIAKGFEADAADMGIVKVLKKWFGVRYENGISWRNNLQNLNTALNQGCSYRLVEFGFITNKEERNIFIKDMDDIALDIAKVMKATGGSWLLIAGHGEGDPGAIGGGYNEADLVRKMNKKIYDHCQKLIKGGTTKTTVKKKAPAQKDKVEKTKIKVVEIPNSYSSKKGDTLQSISKKFDLTVTQLKAYNSKLTNELEPGTFMFLKDQEKKKSTTTTKVKPSTNKSKASVTSIYIVKKGDTLFEIAKKNKTNVENLVKINGLVTERIFVGQKLKVKGSATPKVDKLKAPAKAVKVEAVMNYVENLVKNRSSVDMDRAYNAQCMDLTIAVAFKYFGWWPSGNAVDLVTQVLPLGAVRIKNNETFIPRRGDICIFVGTKYGHTSIATGKGNVQWFESVDQNWNSNGTGLVPAQKVIHNYDGFWGVIRMPYLKAA